MISNFLMGIVYMAIVFVLVRPGSKWSSYITDIADALSSLTQAAIKGSVS